MRAITVWVGGEAREVDVGRGVMGSVFPSAVLDSGVPLILASGRIANGVWGALGVSPADDGMCECFFILVSLVLAFRMSVLTWIIFQIIFRVRPPLT